MRLSLPLQASALVLIAGLMIGCRESQSDFSTSIESANAAESVDEVAQPSLESGKTAWGQSEAERSESTESGSIAPNPDQFSSPALAPPIAASSLAAGRYCYSIAADGLDEVMRLDVADDRTVRGEVTATIANEAAGYYTAYERKLTGTLDGNQLPVDLTTWIEYDVQQDRQNWTMTANQLKTDHQQLTAVDCEAIEERFTHATGLEASDLLDGAARVHRERIEFGAGASSATVESAVVRGDRDLYLLGATGGQTMKLSITSLENNAAFDVVTPSGIILTTESENAELLLPHTGDYQVIVGGTRGNASYVLNVEIL